MSITHVNYIEKQKAVQITLRVFIDDLQTELNLESTTDQIELATDREPKNIDITYHTYLKEKFKININSTEKEFEYLGKKYDHDMVVFYIEIPDIEHIKSIQIQNTILCDLYSEQENILRTDINNIKKSHILTKNSPPAFINY